MGKLACVAPKVQQFRDNYSYAYSVVRRKSSQGKEYSKSVATAVLWNSVFSYFNDLGSLPFRNLYPGPTEKSPPLTASSACFLYAFTFNCSLSTRSWSRRIFFLSSSDCGKWKSSQPWKTNQGDPCRRAEDSQYLVSELLHSPFVLASSFQGFYSSFLLGMKLVF